MKTIYWRPSKIPAASLILIAVLALAGLYIAETFQSPVKQRLYRQKTDAAELALKAFKVIKEERLKRNIALDLQADPTESGLIGQMISPITSNVGVLAAKQSTINPNFAAVAIDLLNKAHVKEGDVVAVSLSGSFPAINICIYAALQTLKVKPIVISTASSSQWGANIPTLSWIDMEKILVNHKIFSFQSSVAAMGGIEDRGVGMPSLGKTMLRALIEKNGIPFLEAQNFDESVKQRMQAYQDVSNGAPIAAYINVGGGAVSIGKKEGRIIFKPGLNTELIGDVGEHDSVMIRMISAGIPVLHFSQIKELTNIYGLAWQPKVMPAVGEGKIYTRLQYNQGLTLVILLGLMVVLYIFIRSDLGFRVFQSVLKSRSMGEKPKQMV